MDPEKGPALEPKWKPFSLTFVVYKEGDVLSQMLAISSLLPLAILVAYGTAIIFRRDLHTIFFCLGQLGNEAVNFVVKHWVQEPRPAGSGTGAHFGKYGFPSNHAQFMWFFTAYLWLFLLLRLKPSPTGRCSIWKLFLLFAVTFTAVFISYGRIELGHHSFRQVWWGAMLGSGIGVVWFSIVHLLFSPFFPLISSWPVCEYLLIRDYSLIPNVILFEYTCARSESRARGRKLSLKRN